MAENLNKERWDEIYKNQKEIQPIDRDFSDNIDFFYKKNSKKVLDLACGSGRYSFYLAKKGFEVHGIDISEGAIKRVRRLLKSYNLEGNFQVGSMFNVLPYDTNYFDAVICIRSLNHGLIENIRNTIKEIERILKARGIVYITVRKKIAKNKRLPFKIIAPRTYIPLEGKEEGVIHYMFNNQTLKKEFSNFKIHKLWTTYGPKDWEAYYCLIGEKKINK